MKVKSENESAQLCPTLCYPMDFLHGSFQARVLEWVAIAFPGSIPRAPLLGLSLYPHPTHGSGNLSHPYWSCQGPAHREFYLRDVERMGHSLDTGLRDRFSGLCDSPWAASSVAWRDGSRSSALGATWLLGRPGTSHPEANRGPRLSQSEGARAVPL